MSTTTPMIFINGLQYSVPTPKYGYEIEVQNRVVVSPVTTGYRFFDCGKAHDTRILRNCEWLLNAAQMTNVSYFFRNGNPRCGRGENITIRLGSTPTGFFPAGPDKGDVGDFGFRAIARKPSSMLHDPWKRFEYLLDLVLVSAPAYNPASPMAEGDFQIGNAPGLLPPQEPVNSSIAFAVEDDLAENGTPYSLDAGSAGDVFTSTWTQQCNTGNAAALLAFLVGINGRGQDIPIVAPANTYLFNVDNGSSGTYMTKLITQRMTWKHAQFNKWTVPLGFWHVA